MSVILSEVEGWSAFWNLGHFIQSRFTRTELRDAKPKFKSGSDLSILSEAFLSGAESLP
jgi:hypothetical protein